LRFRNELVKAYLSAFRNGFVEASFAQKKVYISVNLFIEIIIQRCSI